METHLDTSKIRKIQTELLHWYHRSKRDLPFRKTKNPYNIWLSEIMAQQTTMSAVVPYYNKFIKRFPKLEDVALADEQELLTYWQGLGYYSRIRNFQKACLSLLHDHKGVIPDTASKLVELKGIGTYTAAAIASICFGEPVAVVDGNVKRVLSRLFCYDTDPNSKDAKSFFDQTAQTLLDPKHPGDYNQAIMELGATICTPKSPKCLICPLQSVCLAKDLNPEEFPLKQKQKFKDIKYLSVIITDHKSILLKTPSLNNLIKNMWELPSCYENITNSDPKIVLKKYKFKIRKEFTIVGSVKHAITNKKITNDYFGYPVKSAELTKTESGDFKQVMIKDLDQIPLNTLSRKILKSFFKTPNQQEG